MGALSLNGLLELQICLDELKSLDEKIARLDERIASVLDRDVVERLDAIPGADPVTASVVIAEVADPKRFRSEKQLASWAGLAPSVYQSGGKARYGHITKQGSRWVRRPLTQAACGAVKARNSWLRLYYLRSRRGSQVAIVAVARKLLTIMHHLLVTGENYVENGSMNRGTSVTTDESSVGRCSVQLTSIGT